MNMKAREKRRPGFLASISMIVVLLALVVYSVRLDISIIPALVLSICYSLGIAYYYGYGWDEIMEVVYEKEKGVIGVFFIILMIGMFIAAMMFSGTIPTIIYYIVHVINPAWVIPMTFIICAVISVLIGTSWGTIGTVGVIMIAIAQSMNVPIAIVAGAVASGSHVGQLISPMSDTANVAASFAETDTVSMIKRVAIFTIPTLLFALVGYVVMGISVGGQAADLSAASAITSDIQKVFHVSPILILPMVIVFVMTFLKKPIVQTLGISAIIGILFGVVFNGFDFGNGLSALYSGFSLEKMTTIPVSSLSDVFVNLCNRGGMTSMISPALLVIVASMYGTILLHIKALDVIADTLFSKLHSRFLLNLAVSILATLIIALTSSTFLAAMMPKDLFFKKFNEEGMDGKDLISSVVAASTQLITCIPWCDTAVFIAGIAGVSTLSYLPYNLMGYGTVIFAMVFALLGIGFTKKKEA